MALLNQTEIATALYPCGAAFQLVQASPITTTSTFGDWEICFEKGFTHVVVRTRKNRIQLDKIFENARPEVEKQLDLLSLGDHSRDLGLTEWDRNNLAWTDAGDEQIVHVSSGSRLTFQFGASMKFTDADGNSPTPPVMTHHGSMKYFRQSQATDSLLEAFRNAWLSYEMLLSYLNPPKKKLAKRKKPESESAWVKRATREEFSRTNMYAQAVESQTRDIVSAYHDVRCKIFHAKHGKTVLSPNLDKHRSEICRALRVVTNAYLMLARQHFNVSRSRSFLHPDAVARMHSSFDGCKLMISSSESAASATDTGQEYLDSSVGVGSFSPREDLAARGEVYGVGRIDRRDMQAETPIRKFGVIHAHENILMFTEDLAGSSLLPLDTVDALVFHMTTSIVNLGRPRTIYGY